MISLFGKCMFKSIVYELTLGVERIRPSLRTLPLILGLERSLSRHADL
jgi:hypothetical protein